MRQRGARPSGQLDGGRDAFLLGCGIALVATYLLWPRDDAAEETIPVAT